MPTFGKVNAKQLIVQGNIAKRAFLRKQDSLAARKMTGFDLSRKVSDIKARELAAKFKKEGIIKTHKTAWKVWHDAKKRELEVEMKEKGGGEKKMTTADLRKKTEEELKKRTASARLMEDIHGKKTEGKTPVRGIQRDVKTSALTKDSLTVQKERARVSALESAPSPSSQSVSAKEEPETRTVIDLQI